MELREWAILYVRHKDLLHRRLLGYKEEDGKVTFDFKDGPMTAHVMDVLAVPAISGRTMVFTLHTRDNVDALLRHWPEFARHKDLTVIFVNPKKDEKWLIHPHTHESISDGKVEPGIRTLADGVTYV